MGIRTTIRLVCAHAPLLNRMCSRVGVRWFGDVGKKQDGEISPICSAPSSARGGALTPISELAARGIDLIRRLPDESAIGLIEALLNNESLVAAGVRTRLQKPGKQPPRKSGEIYSVKHNNCNIIQCGIN